MRNNKRQSYPRGRRRKRSSAPFVLLGFVLVAALSFGIAWAWQGQQEKRNEEVVVIPSEQEEATDQSSAIDEIESPSIQEETTPESLPPLAEETAPEEPKESIDTLEEELENTSETLYTRRDDFYYAVEQNSAPVDGSYFDDAIFFGDSISTGIPLYLYPVLGNTPVLAEKGIAPYNALSRELFPVGGVNKTMLEAASSYGERNKIYILLGGNSLGADKDTFIGGYREFLKAVKEQYPDATIYVQSMTPVTTTVTNTYPNLGTGNINEKIYDYNLSIMELAKELGVYYLDIASVFVDGNGNLPEKASPGDGMHFGSDYYYRWYEYLRNHTA